MAAGLLGMFVMVSACASGKSIKQGTEEFSIPEAKYHEALQHYDNGDYFESIRAWSEVLDSEPRFAQGHFNIGLVYDKLNMVPEATEHYEAAIQAAEDTNKPQGNEPPAEDPKNTKAALALYNLHLGAAYLRSSLVDEALLALNKSLEMDPFNPTVHYNLSAAYIAKADWDNALLQADIAVDLASKPDASHQSKLATEVDIEQLGKYLLRQAECHAALGEWDKAWACIDRARTQCKTDLPPLLAKKMEEAPAAESTPE